MTKIANGSNLDYYGEYNRTNNLLNRLVEYATDMLRNKGFAALRKTQSLAKTEPKTQGNELPHRSVDTKAGIG